MVSGFATLEYKFKQNQMGKFIKINESDNSQASINSQDLFKETILPEQILI
jgi:hypothetical protein